MKNSLKAITTCILLMAVVASSATAVMSFRTKPEDIIAAAEANAVSQVEFAESKAVELVSSAEEHANNLVSNAQKEADEIKAKKIAEAKAKAEAEAKKKKLSSSPLKISFPLQLSDADRDLLYHICHAEDGDAGKAGVQAVCWVILNRVASNQFPNTISGVVYQKGQFDPVRNGDINKKPYQSSIDAVDEVLAGNVPDPTNGALYFAMDYADNGSWWKSLTYCGQIGSHNFYK